MVPSAAAQVSRYLTRVRHQLSAVYSPVIVVAVLGGARAVTSKVPRARCQCPRHYAARAVPSPPAGAGRLSQQPRGQRQLPLEVGYLPIELGRVRSLTRA